MSAFSLCLMCRGHVSFLETASCVPRSRLPWVPPGRGRGHGGGGGRRPVARSWETAAVVAGDGGPVRGPRPPWGAWAGVSAPKQTDFFLFSVSRTWVSGRPCCLPGRVPGWRRAAPRAAALGLLPRALGGHETWGMVLEPSVSAESDHAWPSPSSLTAGTRGPQPFHCLT